MKGYFDVSGASPICWQSDPFGDGSCTAFYPFQTHYQDVKNRTAVTKSASTLTLKKVGSVRGLSSTKPLSTDYDKLYISHLPLDVTGDFSTYYAGHSVVSTSYTLFREDSRYNTWHKTAPYLRGFNLKDTSSTTLRYVDVSDTLYPPSILQSFHTATDTDMRLRINNQSWSRAVGTGYPPALTNGLEVYGYSARPIGHFRIFNRPLTTGEQDSLIASLTTSTIDGQFQYLDAFEVEKALTIDDFSDSFYIEKQKMKATYFTDVFEVENHTIQTRIYRRVA